MTVAIGASKLVAKIRLSSESTPGQSTPDKSTPDKSTCDKSTPDKSTPDKSSLDIIIIVDSVQSLRRSVALYWNLTTKSFSRQLLLQSYLTSAVDSVCLRHFRFVAIRWKFITSELVACDSTPVCCCDAWKGDKRRYCLPTVLEIFDFKVFMVRPWPLTPKSHLGSKNLYYSKAHIWLPIWFRWTTSLYLVPFLRYSILKLLRFDLDLWPPKCHLGSKILILFESLYMTCYLASMDNISLSRTVLEIFDFKGFRVWPWPLTPKGHLGSKNVIPFESLYMNHYSTSMDTTSLSRTVLEISDFNVFRVWPWPKGHLGSKQFIPFKSPYMTSDLTSMDTISLSRTVLEIMKVKILKDEQNVGFWPSKGQGQKSIFF